VLGTVLAAVLGVSMATIGLAAPAYAHSSTGTVTGVVTNASSAGVPDVSMYLRYPLTGTVDDENADVTDPILTGDDGSYTINDAPIGTFDLYAYPEPDSTDPTYLATQIASVTVSNGGTTIENVSLVKGGEISGTIVNSGGAPLSDIVVTSDSPNSGTTHTASDGTYVLTGLSYGPHTIFVNTESDNHSIGADQINSAYAPANFSVPMVTTDSSVMDVANTTLRGVSTLSGVLIDGSGKDLAGVEVDAFTLDSNGVARLVAASPVDDPSETVITDASGAFELANLPVGNVYLEFLPYDDSTYGKFTPQFLGGSHEITTSTPVAVSAEGSHLFRQVRITDDGEITGKVTSKKTGKALDDIAVNVLPLVAGSTDTVDNNLAYDDQIQGSATTSKSGTFSVVGLPAGTYQVSFNSPDFGPPPVATSDTVTTNVYVAPGAVVTKNEALTSPTKITGTVKGGDPAEPLTNVEVDAYSYDTATQTATPVALGFGRSIAGTDSHGNYELNLDPGTYVIRVTDESKANAVGYLGGGHTPADASTTKLVVGATALTGKNITLSSAPGSLSADIVDSDGNVSGTYGGPLVGDAALNAVDGESVTGQIADYAFSDFPISNVPDGSYQLVLEPTPDSSPYAIAPTVVTFTMTDGQLSELNNEPASGNSLGLIQLNAPTDTVQPQFTIGGDLPSIDTTTDLTVGDTLTAQNGDWTPTPSEFYYRWFRDGVPIFGATAQTYTITPGDVGHQLAVGLYVSDPDSLLSFDFGSSPDYLTPQTDVVQPALIQSPLSPPSITGTPEVGHTLTGTPGTWADPRLTFSYQWVRVVGTDVPTFTTVGTGTTYKPTTADTAAQTSLQFEVTASRLGYQSVSTFASSGLKIKLGALKYVKGAKFTHTVSTNTYVVSSAGTWTPSGASFNFSWDVHNPSDDSTITPSDTDISLAAPLGDRVDLEITAQKAGYNDVTVVIPVQRGPEVESSGTPSVAGTEQLGFPQYADTGGMTTTPSDATFSYQWYRGSSKISGATNVVYTPTTSDVGKSLSVRVTPKAFEYGTGASVASAPIIVLGGGSFSPGTPTITGTTSVGRTLTGDPGTWNPAATTYTYQWYRTAPSSTPVKISGATHHTYVLATADLGDTVSLVVTGSRSGYTTTHATAVTGTITTLPVTNVTLPTIGTTARVGTALTATPGTWDLSSTTYTYQWQIDGVPVIGATSSKYVPAPTDLGSEVSVLVTAHRSGFTASTPTASLSLTVDLGKPFVATGAPTLSVAGKSVTSLKLGTTVSATPGHWPTSALVLSYQWQVDTGAGWVDLDPNVTGESVTSQTLVLDAADDPTDFAIGYSYRVVVTAEIAGYEAAAPITSVALKAKS
jgi:hypothetical protein